MKAWFDAVRSCVIRACARNDRSPRRRGAAARRRHDWDRLEGRDVLSAVAALQGKAAVWGHLAEVRTFAHAGDRTHGQVAAIPRATIEARTNSSFSVAQLKRILPGKWRVRYDASSLFGPGAQGAQEITFTGPKGVPSFISTTGVVVRGLVGPAYYQFSSWGTYQFLSKKLVRLTITGGSPTEYLNNGIIVPGGQFFPVQFRDKDHFVVQGQVYERIPLNSTIFNS